MRKLLAILALAGLPVLALALDAAALVDGDPTGLLAAILDAVRHGQTGLAIVVALVLAVRMVRQFGAGAVTSGVKSLLKTDDATASDVSGHLVLFATTALVMVAGPLSAGAVLTGALVKTAVLTALSASGGWALLKNFVHPIFAQVPVVGGVLEWLAGKTVQKQLPPAPGAAPTPAAPDPAAVAQGDSLGDTDPHTGP